MAYPTVTLGGARYVIVPAADAARAGLTHDDPAVLRREAIGLRVRRARKRAGLTQAQLGERVGVRQAAVAGVETGRDPCSDERASEWIAACRRAR